MLPNNSVTTYSEAFVIKEIDFSHCTPTDSERRLSVSTPSQRNFKLLFRRLQIHRAALILCVKLSNLMDEICEYLELHLDL